MLTYFPQQRHLNTWASSVCKLCLQILARYIVYHVTTSPLSFCALTFAPLFLCLSLSVCMWAHDRDTNTHTKHTCMLICTSHKWLQSRQTKKIFSDCLAVLIHGKSLKSRDYLSCKQVLSGLLMRS